MSQTRTKESIGEAMTCLTYITEDAGVAPTLSSSSQVSSWLIKVTRLGGAVRLSDRGLGGNLADPLQTSANLILNFWPNQFVFDLDVSAVFFFPFRRLCQ